LKKFKSGLISAFPKNFHSEKRREPMSGMIIRLAETDSTNLFAARCFDEFPDMTVIFAESQTGGRGRLGRRWLSPPGNIYCSMIIKDFPYPLSHSPWIGSLAALAALRRFAPGLSFGVKWPNDIFCSGKKIAGLLAETVKTELSGAGVVLGIGVNVNMSAGALETLGRPAASLLTETGRETDPAAFSSFLAESLFSFRLRVRSDCGTAGLRALWAAESFVTGKNVELSEGGSVLASGRAAGFGPDGELLLETPGGLRAFHSGDISLMVSG
jgi:BirA family biotin operon repressor/biotin-[acetyl-CoA-carboxylase] ligase